jgi:3-hydroxyanthranilate 3,4-dioxygenase
MYQLPVVNLPEQARDLAGGSRPVNVLWQEPGALAFVARCREYRNEFHIDPSDEIMYVIQGELHLYFRTPDGKEDLAVVPEGSVVYAPAGTPHSPRGGTDVVALVIERPRKEGEIDRFQWFCPRCDALVHEEQFIVRDYRDNPVSAAYRHFAETPEFRTCKACGEVLPSP